MILPTNGMFYMRFLTFQMKDMHLMGGNGIGDLRGMLTDIEKGNKE